MIQPKAIDHVCLWVKSLPDSMHYYTSLFGFVCTPRDTEAKTCLVESENIHFFISEAKEDDDFLAKQHISFEVDSLGAVVKTLTDMGITDYKLGEVTFFTQRNYKWCEWRDPSGIRLECIEIV